MKKNTNKNDPDAKELAEECIQKACKYAIWRIKWHLMNNDEKQNNDSYRTSSHNAFMDSLNIFLRYMVKKEDVTAKEILEAIKDSDRKQLGDFACNIAFLVSLEER